MIVEGVAGAVYQTVQIVYKVTTLGHPYLGIFCVTYWMDWLDRTWAGVVEKDDLAGEDDLEEEDDLAFDDFLHEVVYYKIR